MIICAQRKRLKKSLPEDEREKMYVYMLPSLLCGLIIPAEVEEAIRIGEMETVSLSKTCDKAIFKGLFICFFVKSSNCFFTFLEKLILVKMMCKYLLIFLKTCQLFVYISVRGKPTLFVPLKEVDIKATAHSQMLLDGIGQSKETLAKQKRVLEEKKRKTLANKKIFEDLERQADEELQKAE